MPNRLSGLRFHWRAGRDSAPERWSRRRHRDERIATASRWQRLRRHFAKPGNRPLTLHSARHTWATLALRAGKSIRWIAEQLGHSDPAIPLRIYAHVLPDEGQDLAFLDFGRARRTSISAAHDP